jgi:hypothetical protein
MSCFLGLLLASPVMAQDKPEIKLVEHCVTIIICLLERRPEKTRWRFGYDVFRVNAKVLREYSLNAEYRLYSQGGGMLKQGWLGYNLNEKDQTTWFNSSSFWYSTIQLSQLVSIWLIM